MPILLKQTAELWLETASKELSTEFAKAAALLQIAYQLSRIADKMPESGAGDGQD